MRSGMTGRRPTERQGGQAEAQILAAGGVVTAAARESLAEALKLDPANPRARFFMAIALEQDGQVPAAIASLKTLLADAPADAPWTATVRARLEGLERSPAPADAIASLPEAERTTAIRGMVEGLAARLAEGGGSLADWSRLIRSQAVLGEREAAQKSLALARERLVSDQAAATALDGLRSELGLQDAAR
jgi:cytochrome c-type biogenesis protein CcmH